MRIIDYLAKFIRPTAPAADDMTAKTFDHVVSSSGAQVVSSDEKNVVVKFQGGNFVIQPNLENRIADIVYHAFLHITVRNATHAVVAANNINTRYAPWTCYVQNLNDSTSGITASLSYRLFIGSSAEETGKMMAGIMESAFSVARSFTAEYERLAASADDYRMLFNEVEFNENIAKVRNMLELTGSVAFDKAPQKRKGRLTVGAIASLYLPAPGHPERLRVLTNKQCRAIEGESTVEGYDIAAFIKENHTAADLDDITVIADYAQETLLVYLAKAPGGNDQSIFYRMTAQLVQSNANPLQTGFNNQTRQMLVEIRLADGDKAFWEAKYMVDEARDKLKTTAYGEMTTLQQAILYITNINVQYEMYWAERFYNNGCYYQALDGFLSVHNFITASWKDFEKEKKDFYYRLCEHIGIIMLNIGKPVEALHFLEKARHSGSIRAIEHYIDCAISINDPASINILANYFEELNSSYDSEEAAGEQIAAFEKFLNRRFAFATARLGYHEEAERHLLKMIKRNKDTDFAKEQLKMLYLMQGKGGKDKRKGDGR